jgi:hypothetical protein
MERDPNWEWIELRRFCDPEPTWVRGRCNHLTTVKVESPDLLGGELHGRLCVTCDRLLESVA